MPARTYPRSGHDRRGRLLVAALACIAVPCLAQPLISQSAVPTGRNLGGVAGVGPGRAFVVGENHHLIETSDGGQTWTTRMATALSTDPFYAITFPDALHGYLAGNGSDSYRTTDGGVTWTPMTSMVAGSTRVLDFITPTTGFAGANGAMTWTPDGGVTWQLRSGYPICPVVYGMDFRDDLVGIVAGYNFANNIVGLHRTADGGVTWTTVHEGYTNDVIWLDQFSAVAVSGIDVVRSDDQGQTWYTAAYWAIDTGISKLARVGSSSRLAGVSHAGDIWISDDLGYSWARVVEGIGVLPADWCVTFPGESEGWVVGQTGLVYRTTDGGDTWTLLNSGCGDEVLGIDFADENFGVAVTRNGYVFRTRDRGAQWDVSRLKETGLIFGRDEGLNAVDVVDPEVVVAGGTGGLLFRSTDGGDSWTSIGWPNALPEYLDIQAVKFVDRDNGWIGSFYSQPPAQRTYDGGFTWVPVDVQAGIIAIDFKGQRGWLCSAGSVVYRSTDLGETWTASAPAPNGYGLSDLAFADENTGYVVGWYGTMAKSTSGGATWTEIPQPQNETYFDVSVVSPTEAWTVGYDHDTFTYFYKRTTNGGSTWTKTTFAFEEWISRLHVRSSGRAWFGGAFGKIAYMGAPALTLTLPTDPPRAMPPRTASTLPVRIAPGDEQVVAASPTLWFRRQTTEAYQPIPLVHVAGDDYLAEFPVLHCADHPQFYFSAQGDAGSTVRLPAGAPAAAYGTLVGVYQTQEILSVAFESGLPAGWTATGLWHVTPACAPPGLCGAGARAYFGQDATCSFDTGARVSGVLATPYIALPQLDPGQPLTMSFCHALSTENGEGALSDSDQAIVYVRSGADRVPLEWCVDRDQSTMLTYDLAPFAGNTVRFEWAFDSMDQVANAFRGWHADNVVVRAPVLVCDDVCPADFNADGFVDGIDYDQFNIAFENPDLAQQMAADFNGDGFVDGIDYDEFNYHFATGC